MFVCCFVRYLNQSAKLCHNTPRPTSSFCQILFLDSYSLKFLHHVPDSTLCAEMWVHRQWIWLRLAQRKTATQLLLLLSGDSTVLLLLILLVFSLFLPADVMGQRVAWYRRKAPGNACFQKHCLSRREERELSWKQNLATIAQPWRSSMPITLKPNYMI